MKITPPSRSWLTVTSMLIFAMTVGLVPQTAYAADVHQGDQIKLTREEPLQFRDQVVRTGKEGEFFTVLVYRPEQKKVFVLGKDNDGKDVALSVSEDAVAVVTKKLQ